MNVRILKKKLFSALVIMFALSLVLPPRSAPANMQTPVTDLILSCMPGGTGTNTYTVKLHWSRPLVSAKPDNAALPEYASAPHPNAEAHMNYALCFRNATRRESASAPFKTITGDDSPELEDTSAYNLAGGSLYEYKVTPYHTHKYSVRQPNGSYVTVDGTAPADASVPEARGYLLTDISVSAKGSGDSLTVTWDNPTLDGVSVFSGYRIYYILGGSRAGFIPLESYRTVMRGDPELLTEGGRLTYTVTDANLEIGKPYAVKVEPLMNGGLARSQTEITAGGVRPSFPCRSITTDEYRANDAYVSPSLTAAAEGRDFVRLTWSNVSTSIQSIDRVEIFAAGTADAPNNALLNPALLGTLAGPDASRNINYWLAARPAAVMYYQARIFYTDMGSGKLASMLSDVAVFNPAYTDFTPYKPAIESLADSGPPSYRLTAVWDAFAREPYNPQEAGEANADFGGLYVDRNVEYIVHITDDIRNFDGGMPGASPNAVLPASSLPMSSVALANGNRKPVYSHAFTDYWRLAADGSFARKPLENNRIYYIRIAARRTLAGGLTGKESAPAVAAHFIPPSGALPTNPNMISRPPLRIKKDALGADIVTENSIAIQWDIKYYEIYNPGDGNWYTQVGADADGNPAFGRAADGLSSARAVRLNNPAYTGAASDVQAQALIRADLAALSGLLTGGAAGLPVNLEECPLRLIDLRGCRFEIHTVRYEVMASAGGYEAYMDALLRPGNEKLWHTVTPAGEPNRPEYEVTAENSPVSGPLAVNTAYVVYFRPYITADEVKAAYFPNYVMATTLSPRASIGVIPTVPSPEAVSATDTSLTLRWKYSQELRYELRWAENPASYPNGGMSAQWAALSGAAVIDREYMLYTITGLFPQTQYHVWIRAGAASSESAGWSEWSNPITMTTSDILPPDPPKGLGPASRTRTDAYNEANGADLRPVAEDYFIAEWMRDARDTDAAPPAGAQAQTGASGDRAEAIDIPNAGGMYAALFSGLTANRVYYVRAKTLLTVTKAGGVGVRAYFYTVQAADNPDFTGATEITVPARAGVPAPGPAQARRAESAWSGTVMILTAKTGGEYDGNANPEMYPLPARDFEVSYDWVTDTLTYRFRSGGTGAADNQAGQRLISRLISDRTYVYTVDLTKYGPARAANMVVEVPCSVMRAFAGRKIELLLVSERLTAAFPPGSLETAEVKALRGCVNDTCFRFTVSMAADMAAGLHPGEEFACPPQELAIAVMTPSGNVPVKRTAAPVRIELRPDEQYRAAGRKTSARFRDGNTAGWMALSSDYDFSSGRLRLKTYRLGIFAAVAVNKM